jgi:PAS domain S-box-containing protein
MGGDTGMSRSDPSESGQPETVSQESSVAGVLLRAIDESDDASAVFAAVRGVTGSLVDLRVLYANDGYWALSGLDPASAVGRPFSELAPGIDWTRGLAGLLFEAMQSRRSYVDHGVRSRPQLGPHAGEERVFDVAFTVLGDVLALRSRDISAEIQAAEREAAEAQRSAALATFLQAAVDPSIGRSELLAKLASEIATTIGNLCLIVEQAVDGIVTLAAVAGGPGDVASRLTESHSGRPLPIPDSVREAVRSGQRLFFAPIPSEIREGIGGAMKQLGLSEDLAAAASSIIAVPILSGGVPIGRIHLLRFDDDLPYTPGDLLTVEAIAAAASLVLQRRGIEDELATSLARFEALFEQVPVAMVAVGPDRETRHNRAALDLFARDVDEMTRLSFSPGAPWIPEDQVDLWAEMRRRVATGERLSGWRFALVRPDGERREIEGAAFPVSTRSGASGGVVTVLTDLTERLELEAQFRHAQKMEALGRLAGGVAHDFNNVLMAILGFAEFIVEDSREAGVPSENADQVVAATHRAIELTARLTTFARRDAARQVPVEVAELVRALTPLVTRLAPESIQVVTHLEPGPAVMLDRSEFEQALVNLVVNAIDAMPNGGRITIEVETIDLGTDHAATHLGEVSGPHVLVAVSDSGVGMDEATRARVFEPFYTTKGVGEGTGLGLAMVFAAVERAAGKIWVYSEPGQGTTFKIYLPPAEPGAREVRGRSGDPIVVAGGSESILLLEDDALVRDLVTKVLRGLGYEVTVASRPSEAIAVAADRRFDLLLSDVVMPEMMGDTVAARLRVTQPDLPVVFMSGYTARALEFIVGPQDSFVYKPLAPSDLAAVVRRALDATAG